MKTLLGGIILALPMLLGAKQFQVGQRAFQPSVTCAANAAAWPMNEGSGTSWLDHSGNANTETFSSGIGSWGTVSGFPGTVFTFNGTGGSTGTNQTTTNFSGSTPFTVWAWVEFNSVTGFVPLLSTIQGSGTYTGWDFAENGGDVMQLRLISNYGTSNYVRAGSTTLLSTGQLYFVLGTYDGTGLTTSIHIWVNGVDTTVLDATVLTGSITNSNVVQLGTDRAGDPNLSGTMAFAGIYAGVPTSGQIAAAYAAGPSTPCF